MSNMKKPIENRLEILIVEDSPTQAEKLRFLLERQAYRVLFARDGKQALAILKETRPDLVISDIIMPEMNGFELCRRIKTDENTRLIPVVLLTSLSDLQDVVESLACGADSFMTKPYSEDYLLKHVEQTVTNQPEVLSNRAGVEVEILLMDTNHVITAEPQQMLNLLLSTYEAAVHRNTELVQTQNELSSLNEHLEDLVERRTDALSAEVTARKQAEEEIRHRLSELEAIYDSSLAFGHLLQPKEIGQKIIDILSEKLHWQYATIRQYTPESETLEMLAFIQPGLKTEAEQLAAEKRVGKIVTHLGHGFASWVIQHSQPVYCSDVTKDLRYSEVWPDIHSGLYVPLRIGERTIGCLSVESEQNNAFTETDEWLITTLATLAASALENARLFEETRQRLAESEAVNKISIALRTAESLDDMLSAFLDKVLTLLDTRAGAIWLYDAGNEELLQTVSRGRFNQLLKATVKPGEGLTGTAFITGKVQLSHNLLSDAPVLEAYLGQVPSGWGGICVPIRSAQAVVGVLLISVQLPRELTTGEIRVLNTLAEIVGIAIQRMRSHEQTEQQLQHVRALHEIDKAIAASFDLSLTLETFLKNVLAQLHVDAASILLLNPQTRLLEYTARKGFRIPDLEYLPLRPGEDYAGRVVLERQIIHAADLRADNTSPVFKELIDNEGFISYYGVPLVVKGAVIGVMEIFHRTPLKPNAEWLGFMDTLAGQAAIAIDNSLSYNNLQLSKMELLVTYDKTLEGWSRALDMRDKETEGHSQRVTEVTMHLARILGVKDDQMEHIRRGALLHDIGKIGIPDSILLKPGPLTDEEWEVMRTHPGRAYEMLAPIPYLRPALEIPYCHHEKWDGSGYPRALKGEEIPLAARIFAISDIYDALRSDRPYRKAWSKEKANQYIQDGAGTRFDPQVVKKFLLVYGKE